MPGLQNHHNGLYDIPIDKTTMTHDNFVMPKLHGHIVAHKQLNIVQQSIPPKSTYLTQKIK